MILFVSCILQAAEKPNVLFIAVDDLNDWVGVLDGNLQAKTPNLDRLAQRGVYFVNAHCSTPVCNSSRHSLMSGLLTTTSGWYASVPLSSIEKSYESVLGGRDPLPSFEESSQIKLNDPKKMRLFTGLLWSKASF